MRWIFLPLVIALLPFPAIGQEGKKEGGSDLVVHEWGVLIRKETFPPTVGPAEALLESLPGFVELHSTYKPQEVFRPWNKPVLHFYGKEQEVSVEILTASGRPAAYWPKPSLIEETFWRMGDGLTDAVGMHWQGRLSKVPVRNTVPKVEEEHWWNTARGVEGLWFNMGSDSERFIFYEGTGLGEPTVVADIEGDQLLLKNRDENRAEMVLVIVNDGKKRYLTRVPEIGPGETLKLPREEAMAQPVSREELEAASVQQWVSYGMTEGEAEAITAIWESDLWDTKGFLIVSRMPSHIYDEYIFPIKIEPEPDELVRAAVIFDTMPGTGGRLAWLPGFGPEIESHLAGLSSPDPVTRERATSQLTSYGDLARDVLEAAADSGDLEAKMRVKALIEKLGVKPAENLPTHMKGGVPEPKVTNESRLGRRVELRGKLEVRNIEKQQFTVLVHEKYGDIVINNLRREVKEGEEVVLSGRFIPPSHGFYRFSRGFLDEGARWAFQVEAE